MTGTTRTAVVVGALGAALAAMPAPAATLPDTAVARGPSALVAGQKAPEVEDPARFSFVVLGHVRGGRDGDLHYLLDELLAKVRSAEPDFAVLTGDMIWGQVHLPNRDAGGLRSEWQALDDTLATLGIPIFRVPGNHDVNDSVTARIFRERYDTLPRAFDVGNSRFVLLNSAWAPRGPEEERRQRLFARGMNLSESDVEFLERVLPGDGSYEHAFVFMHHLLWWDDPHRHWWEEVHPVLVDGGVDAVFTGDYGPMKFSHRRADGIDYFQSGIAPRPSLDMLRSHETHRLLAQQFDNFLEVTVDGGTATVDVETVGATESGQFSPGSWRDLTGAFNSWDAVRYPGFRYYAREVVTHSKGRWVILALALALVATGFGGAVLVRRLRGR